MEDLFGLSIPLVAIASIFIGLPWIILHYVTKWRQSPKITVEDEQLLDDMFNLARRLEERLVTVERIAAADHPDWKPGLSGPGTDWRPGLNAPSPEWQGARTATPYSLDKRN